MSLNDAIHTLDIAALKTYLGPMTGPKLRARIEDAIARAESTDMTGLTKHPEYEDAMAQQPTAYDFDTDTLTADNIDSAEDVIKDGSLSILDHMALYQELYNYLEAESDDGSGLDWYNDGATHHPDYSEPLTDRLTHHDAADFFTIDGEVVEWRDDLKRWVKSSDSLDERIMRESELEAATTAEEVCEGLNWIGALIRTLDSASREHELVTEAGARIIQQVGDGADLDSGPDDTEGVWFWDDKQLVHGEGWQFTTEPREV
jgi:hypothetical protein